MEHEKKCNKYEGMFIFQDENTFYEHINQCPDCLEEHKKYLKVSELVKEVAPSYLKRKQKRKISAIKRLACCFIAFAGLSVFTGYKVYDNYIYTVNYDYDSYITSLGLPADDYGFLDL